MKINLSSMNNVLKAVCSIAIGVVVGAVTYLSTKGDKVSKQSSDQDNSESGGELLTSTTSRRPIGGQSRFGNTTKIRKEADFIEFLNDSKDSLEGVLRIIKNIILSLDYMVKIFSAPRMIALPPAS